jgi:hypothetical protein
MEIMFVFCEQYIKGNNLVCGLSAENSSKKDWKDASGKEGWMEE